MWEGVEQFEKDKDLTWLVDGMKNNTLIWVANGSCDRNRAPNVSGAGLIIYCKKSDKRLAGKFFEISSNTGSYRAEQLGLCAIYILIAALRVSYEAGEWHTIICCDNQRSVSIAARKLQRIRLAASCANILRSIRSSGNKTKARLIYKHVDGYMDRYLLWHQLFLDQKLNYICDSLAKTGIAMSIRLRMRREGRQLLPSEDAAVFINGEKQTSDLRKAL